MDIWEKNLEKELKSFDYLKNKSMILRKLFILIFKSICIKTYLIFNINEAKYKILEKKISYFFF